MKERQLGIKLAGAAFFISGWFYILFAVFLIASGIYAKYGDFTGTIPWTILELIIGGIKKVIPNIIEGMTPSAYSVPFWWKQFSYLHAFLVLFLLAFGIFILRIRSGLYKRKKKYRIIAMSISYFFAIYSLFLSVLWLGGRHGPLVIIITTVFIVIYFYMGMHISKTSF